VEVDLAREANAADFNLELSVQNVVVRDWLELSISVDVLNEAETNLLQEGESVAGCRDLPAQLSIAVYRLVPRRPDIDVNVVIVEKQLDVNPLNAFFLLPQQSIATDELLIELNSPGSATFKWRRESVQVLPPKGEEFLDSQRSHGVISTVVDAVFLALLPQLSVNVQGELVWDVNHEAELASVRQVKGSYAVCEANVQFLVGEERKILWRQVSVCQLRQQLPGEWSHYANCSVG